MPILVRHRAIAPALNAAAGIGQFSADRQLTAENLRAQQFADEQQRAAAQITLSANAQGFGQQQANRDFDFRQEQADYGRAAQQQQFDAQRSYQQDALGAGLERARIGAEADYATAALRGQQQQDLAGVQGQFGLQREGLRQDATNERADEANQLRFVLAGMGVDARTASNEQQAAARQRLQELRGQQQQDLAGVNYGYRGALQDDQQAFQQGQQGRQFDNQQALQRQRIDARPAGGTNGEARLDLAQHEAMRRQTYQQLQAVQAQIGFLQRAAAVTELIPGDKLGSRRPTADAVAAQRQLNGDPQQGIPSLFQTLAEMRRQFEQLPQVPQRAAGPAGFTDADPAALAEIYQQAGGTAPAAAEPVQGPDGSRWVQTGQVDANGRPIFQRVQ